MPRQVIRNADGQPFSRWKPAPKFAWVWGQEAVDFEMPTIEYSFNESRMWRFDFAWPAQMVAVEIDGFGHGHQAAHRLSENHEKQNAAIEQGWRVLRYTSRQLGSRQGVSDAVEQVCRVLCTAK